ncbi:MAG: hypothetical protein AAB414_04530 [Patescibacteria group bacterium]
MAEYDELLKPPPGDKTFLNWTDQESEDFGKAFSLEDFELIEPKKEGEESYVLVRVPLQAEGILVESITNLRRVTE